MNLAPHHHPEFTKRFFSGAARDLGKERDIRGKEYYFDALNMRPTSLRGNLGDMERIGGSVLDFQYVLADTYVNISSFFVGERLVCIWVDEDGLLEPVITVDNYVVCRSENLPFYLGVHIQLDVDAFQGGGFFAITNNETPPLIFDIQDMIDNIGETRYFTDFVRENYEINLPVPLDRPVFTDLVYIGGTSGVKMGQHEYYIRYVSDSGDKTLLSYSSPLIAVPLNYKFFNSETTPSYLFPFYKTRGGDATELNSPYGVKIKFRVNNTGNYDYIEIVRASYSNGEGIEFTPTLYIIKKIGISDGEFSIKEFIDCEVNIDTPIALTEVESQTYLVSIQRAFSLRFHNRKLVLTNIGYDEFDMSEMTFKFSGTPTSQMFPVTDVLTNPLAYSFIDYDSLEDKAGFKGALSHAYKKTYMHSERYGFGILGIGGSAQKSFVRPIDNFENYTMPQRRMYMSSLSRTNSVDPVWACNVSNSLSRTFEIFDLTKSHIKNVAYDLGYINILDINDSDNYAIRYPKNLTDENNNHWLRNVVARIDTGDGSGTYYEPYGYGERWHSLGMALAGIEDYPEEMKAFSVVRTRRAGRVICQGIASYFLTKGVPGFSAASKSRDEVCFHSLDIINGIIPREILSNIAANPSNYKVVIESPVGFFMDVFNSLSAAESDNSIDSKTDMIISANVYVEQDAKRINLGEDANSIGVADGSDGYTSYGKWRNATHGVGDSAYGDGDDGTHQFTISEFEEVINTESEGVTYFRIKFTENIYKTESVPEGTDFDANQDWCEPFYIISIIDDGKDVQDSNISEYVKTEHYQKIESLIGVSSGLANQKFEIVDERPDDFFVGSGDTSTNKFIFVDDGSGFRKLYINITEKLAGDITDINTDIANETDLYCGEVLHGTFTATYEDGVFYIDFTGASTPPQGSSIYVFYDNRFPIKFFGGDAFSHNAYQPRLHRNSLASGLLHGSEFYLGCGLPYYEFDLNPDINIVIKTEGGLDDGKIQKGVENNGLVLGDIRQMILSYPATCFSNLALAYNEFFPLVNYVVRPNSWNPNKLPSEQNIYPDYETDYPDEQLRWKFGGFRINQSYSNLDFSKENITQIFFSQPRVGFTLETEFYNRYAWSLPKPINTAKVPSWRTFLTTNVFDGVDKFGQNKYLFSQRINKGDNAGLENLICFNEQTANELLTERVYIASADGGTLQTVGQTGLIPFISEEIPIRGEDGEPAAGMPSYLWKFAGEIENSIYYFDNRGAHRISDKYQEISFLYHSKIRRLLSSLPKQYSTDLFYQKYIDLKNREYGLRVKYTGYKDVLDVDGTIITSYGSINGCVSGNIGKEAAKIVFNDVPTEGTFTYCISNVGSETVHVWFNLGGLFVVEVFEVAPSTSVTYTISDTPDLYTLSLEYEDGLGDCECCKYVSIDLFPIFSERKEVFNWIGEYDYDYDYFCSSLDTVYGFKDGRRYRLDEHDYPMKSRLDVMFSPEIGWFKEFVRFNISASKKPDTVYFLDNDESIIGTVLSSNIRPYGSGFEQYVPLNSVTRKRIQKKNLLQRIVFDETSDDIIVSSSSIQYRKIK